MTEPPAGPPLRTESTAAAGNAYFAALLLAALFVLWMM